MEPINISLEFTPNPNTLKFVVNRTLTDQMAVNFPTVAQAEHAPLIQKIFEVPGIDSVLLGKNFITITKNPTGQWDIVADGIPKVLETYLDKLPVLGPDWKAPEVPKGTGGEVERKVRELLDMEIRPAVAMDGGDIIFDRFENGVVYLHLQGSCSSCPSSVATLKMGVETRLREAIPEVKEVVQA